MKVVVRSSSLLLTVLSILLHLPIRRVRSPLSVAQPSTSSENQNGAAERVPPGVEKKYHRAQSNETEILAATGTIPNQQTSVNARRPLP